jgi:hypothetical protein
VALPESIIKTLGRYYHDILFLLFLKYMDGNGSGSDRVE